MSEIVSKDGGQGEGDACGAKLILEDCEGSTLTRLHQHHVEAEGKKSLFFGILLQRRGIIRKISVYLYNQQVQHKVKWRRGFHPKAAVDLRANYSFRGSTSRLPHLAFFFFSFARLQLPCTLGRGNRPEQPLPQHQQQRQQQQLWQHV